MSLITLCFTSIVSEFSCASRKEVIFHSTFGLLYLQSTYMWKPMYRDSACEVYKLLLCAYFSVTNEPEGAAIQVKIFGF